MKKVAVVSCYFKTNYGSMLQAYAMQMVLDRLGVANETVDISGIGGEIRNGKLKYYLKNLFNFPMYDAKKGFVRLIVKRKTDPKGVGAQIQTRFEAFRRFQETYFRLSGKYGSKAELSESCGRRYTDVLVGSDQLWLPLNIEADYYTLTFVPKGINKIAYATSFGVSAIPFYEKKKTADFLSRIEHISVREKSGQKIVKDLTNRDVPIACDPVLLFTGEEWLTVRNETGIWDGPYIFCYFLGNHPEHRAFARRLQKKTGLKIIALRHLDEYIPSDDTFGDFAPFDIGPGEFIDLISRAAYVCTDSFHGTAFSILFRKNFFTFPRFRKAGNQSTNSRIESLLSMLGISDRLLGGGESVELCLGRKIDYEGVYMNLEAVRKQSLAFLEDALGIGGGLCR